MTLYALAPVASSTALQIRGRTRPIAAAVQMTSTADTDTNLATAQRLVRQAAAAEVYDWPVAAPDQAVRAEGLDDVVEIGAQRL